MVTADDFKLLVDALEKSANRTRSIYYIFSVIYISITLYAVNAFVFSIPRLRLEEFRNLVECQQHLMQGNASKTERQQQINDPSALNSQTIDNVHCDVLLSYVPPKILSPELEEFDRAGSKHRQDTYLDEIASSRKFTFPLFGVSVDEDYFWLMNSMVGLILYFVLISALSNDSEHFAFMVKVASGDQARLRVVLSTQMLSSTSDHVGKQVDARYVSLKSILLRSVLVMPIATGLLWIAYDLHLLDIVANHFSADSFSGTFGKIKDDLRRYPISSAISFVVQASSTVVMLFCLKKIMEILAAAQLDYGMGACKLASSELASASEET